MIYEFVCMYICMYMLHNVKPLNAGTCVQNYLDAHSCLSGLEKWQQGDLQDHTQQPQQQQQQITSVQNPKY